MEKISAARKLTLCLGAAVAALAMSAAPVFAQHVGGSSRAVGHGGAYGGFHGGYGYRGYGGWGWRGGYWGWGWGGLGLGLYFATLPYYYSTYWWGGVPYYYADNTYFRWDGTVGQYVTVAPPAGAVNQAPGDPAGAGAGQASTSELMVYPKNGQTQDQVGKDKYECHKWATSQTGFDPTQAGGASPNRRPDYLRAQAACLEGRGYSVK
jgi:hypothetical protein